MKATTDANTDCHADEPIGTQSYRLLQVESPGKRKGTSHRSRLFLILIG